MVEPSAENNTITAAISSQPLSRSRCASAATATSSALVAKLTEMKAPMAMMKVITPIWPAMRPRVSVSMKPDSGLRSPWTPFTGASTSWRTVSATVSGGRVRS